LFVARIEKLFEKVSEDADETRNEADKQLKDAACGIHKDLDSVTQLSQRVRNRSGFRHRPPYIHVVL
jgi:hypothetical protein